MLIYRRVYIYIYNQQKYIVKGAMEVILKYIFIHTYIYINAYKLINEYIYIYIYYLVILYIEIYIYIFIHLTCKTMVEMI